VELAIHTLNFSLARNRDSPARRGRRTRIIQTIEALALAAPMAATVPVSTLLGIVGRWIVSAGEVKERAPEKNKDQFRSPEAA
jgi:hypothetical protein